MSLVIGGIGLAELVALAMLHPDGKAVIAPKQPEPPIPVLPGRYIVTNPHGGTVRRTAPKIGRNDPCPCGSGSKFKKCCGK